MPMKSMLGFGILHFLSENVIMEMRSSMALVERTLGTHFNDNAIWRCMSFLQRPQGGETVQCIWTIQGSKDLHKLQKTVFDFITCEPVDLSFEKSAPMDTSHKINATAMARTLEDNNRIR